MALNPKVTAALLCALGLATGLVSGCNNNNPPVNPALSGVTYSAQPGAGTATVQLNFDPTIQTDLGGTYEVNVGNSHYGKITVTPFTDAAPFNVSYTLDPKLAADPALAQLTPVSTIHSGQPIPVPGLKATWVELKLKSIPETGLDVYVYADIAGKQWLGLAAVLNYLDVKSFPPDLTVSQGYDPDKAGQNQIWGSFFGPKVDANGNLVIPGGIALFANAASILATGPTGARTLANTGTYLFQGPQATYYASHPGAALMLDEAVHHILNSL